MKNDNTKDWKKFKHTFEKEIAQEMEEEEGDGEDGDTAEETQPSKLAHPDYSELEEKLTLAEQKAHENWEKAARAIAELENLRRRSEKDISNAHRYGTEKFINALLPVADSLEQALQLADKENQPAMHQGLALTMQLFLSALEKQGVAPLDPLSEPFNPQEHEAMAMQEFPDLEPNTIAQVVQKGYKLADRIIRPARVIVVKAP